MSMPSEANTDVSNVEGQEKDNLTALQERVAAIRANVEARRRKRLSRLDESSQSNVSDDTGGEQQHGAGEAPSQNNGEEQRSSGQTPGECAHVEDVHEEEEVCSGAENSMSVSSTGAACPSDKQVVSKVEEPQEEEDVEETGVDDEEQEDDTEDKATRGVAEDTDSSSTAKKKTDRSSGTKKKKKKKSSAATSSSSKTNSSKRKSKSSKSTSRSGVDRVSSTPRSDPSITPRSGESTPRSGASTPRSGASTPRSDSSPTRSGASTPNDLLASVSSDGISLSPVSPRASPSSSSARKSKTPRELHSKSLLSESSPDHELTRTKSWRKRMTTNLKRASSTTSVTRNKSSTLAISLSPHSESKRRTATTREEHGANPLAQSTCVVGASSSASSLSSTRGSSVLPTLSREDWIERLGASLEKGPSEDRKRRPDDRTDMWALPERPGETLYLREPRDGGAPSVYSVRYATLNRLVELLTTKVPEQETEHEKFTMVFLTTYQSFTTPESLMRKLVERFRVPCYAEFSSNPPEKEGAAAAASASEKREFSDEERAFYVLTMKQVCNALRHWFTNYFLDFNMATRRVLQEFVKESRSLTLTELDIPTRFLEKTVTHKLEKGTFKSMFSSDLLVKNPPPPLLPRKASDPKNVDWNALTFMEVNSTEIARQITIADYHLYADMQPVELLNLAWSKPRLKKRAPHVLGLIERFNNFSTSVATLLLQCNTLKSRRRMLTKVIEVMDELLLLNNFNAVMAFMSALNNSAVFRLKHTFGDLKKPVFERFQHFADLLSSTQSFKNYRDTYDAVHPPAIPFLGVYLTDLTFIEDGNPDEVQGMVNYFKRTLVFDVIKAVRRYQTTCYNLKMVPQMQRYLDGLPRLDEDEMYKISLELEPRNTSRKDIN